MNLHNLKFWSRKGVILEQKKEPALSRDLQQFFSSQPTSATAEALKEGETVTLERLIRLSEEANIIDEQDGKPLAKILRKWLTKPCNRIVADAIDDEPYVSSQTNPMMKRSADAAYGLRLLQTALQPKSAEFAVYKEMYYLKNTQTMLHCQLLHPISDDLSQLMNQLMHHSRIDCEQLIR